MVAVDRSLFEAKGVPWHKKDQKIGKKPNKPFDPEADWGYSDAKDKWIYGYGAHLGVTASKRSPVFPLFGTLTSAKVKGLSVLKKKFLPLLPKQTEHLLGDNEYEDKAAYEQSKRRLLTPIRETVNRVTKRKAMSEERKKRKKFFKSKRGQGLYRLRNSSVEPAYNVLKNIFNLEPSWFFGKAYTETLFLLSVWAYQIFVAYYLLNGLPCSRIPKIKPFLDSI